ncbi:hypothetical protein LEP1GSC198_1159, partial [Leptospira kirschneri str. JB]
MYNKFGGSMKKRFSEEQIHKVLKESESGESTPEV